MSALNGNVFYALPSVLRANLYYYTIVKPLWLVRLRYKDMSGATPAAQQVSVGAPVIRCAAIRTFTVRKVPLLYISLQLDRPASFCELYPC